VNPPELEEATSHELLRLAMNELVGQAALKDRIKNAARFLIQIDAHDWPEKLHTEMRDLRRTLQSERALRGESAVVATVRKLSIHECETICKRLVDLTFSLLESVPLPIEGLSTTKPAPLASREDDNIIPLFGEL